ncbi:hypothetical protein HWI79_183 [Cryptosporidium felis]|nr:hypothetical protein HWI79_183 [Cryptosporidium felis]
MLKCKESESLSNVSYGNLIWKTFDNLYKDEVLSLNDRKQSIMQNINELMLNNETNLTTGIDFIINSTKKHTITENQHNFSELLPLETLFGNDYDTNLPKITEYFKFLDNSLKINKTMGNLVGNDRILQMNYNRSKDEIYQRPTSSLNYNPIHNPNLPVNYNQVYTSNYNQRNINYQPTINKPSLSGLLSITNPAFKMIVSTVLMCLGSTPYGAIAVLVVVTVYTLVEIVIKYFHNKAKNKNIIKTMQKISTNKLPENMENNSDTKNNSLLHSSRNTTRTYFRNLKSERQESNFNNIEEVISSIYYENMLENDKTEQKFEFFMKYLSNFVVFTKSLEMKKKGFIAENITENLTIRVMKILNKLMSNKNVLSEITKGSINPKELGNLNYLNENNESYVIPYWYRNLCAVYINTKTKMRTLEEKESDNWVPIKENLISNSQVEINKRIIEIENLLGNQSLLNGDADKSSLFTTNIDEYSKNEILPEQNNIRNYDSLSNKDLLGQNDSTESKWYDKMIKYSIQSYRQNGVRGVITMILDIFSTIFSATPIGYLVITLIRLVAFMTDKLLLLTRRRKNQYQLSRILFEVPEIFDDVKLPHILKELGSIEIQCNKDIKSLTKLFNSLVNKLRKFNPKINDNLIMTKINVFVEIVQNKNFYNILNDVNSRAFDLEGSWEDNRFLYSEGTPENDNIRGWTLNRDNKQTNNEAGEFEITSKVVKETKHADLKGSSEAVKNSFQNMIGGLKSFLINLFKSIFGGAGELWDYIKGLLLRIIDFIKSLWDVIRGERKKRILIDALIELPEESVVHSHLFEDIKSIILS